MKLFRTILVTGALTILASPAAAIAATSAPSRTANVSVIASPTPTDGDISGIERSSWG